MLRQKLKPILFKIISNSILGKKGAHIIFACSKSTIETVEKGVKYVQS